MLPIYTDRNESISPSQRSNRMRSRSRSPVGSFRIDLFSWGPSSRNRNSGFVLMFLLSPGGTLGGLGVFRGLVRTLMD